MPKWEVFGASFATFVSRFMTLVASLLFLHYKFDMISLKHFSFREMLNSWYEILKIGVPSILTQLVIPVSVALITQLASSMEHKDQLVSTLQVGSRVDFFAIAVVVSLGTVLVPFIAQNYGAKNYERIKKSLRISRRFTIFWGIAMTIFFITIRYEIGPIFLKDKPISEPNCSFKITIFGSQTFCGPRKEYIVSGSSWYELSKHQPILDRLVSSICLFDMLNIFSISELHFNQK